MPVINFSDLPGNLRVQLSDKGKQELWHRVDEFGGVKNLSEAFDYSSSKIYNWKSKDLFLPTGFVQQIMGENNTEEIICLKGPASSGKIENPEFPLEISRELLTRVRTSVKVNADGTPVYLTPEKSLAERFAELLEDLGEVEYSIYSRDSRFELRYPKFLQEIFANTEFEKSLIAEVDESGEIEGDKIILEEREIPVADFDQEVFSREKSFELALERGDSGKIAELMAEESEKVRSLLDN